MCVLCILCMCVCVMSEVQKESVVFGSEEVTRILSEWV